MHKNLYISISLIGKNGQQRHITVTHFGGFFVNIHILVALLPTVLGSCVTAHKSGDIQSQFLLEIEHLNKLVSKS